MNPTTISPDSPHNTPRPELHGWRFLLANTFYPGSLIGACMLAYYGLAQGAPRFVSVTGVVLLFGVIFFCLERVLPFTEQWQVEREDFGLDLIHSVSTSAVSSLVDATVLGGVAVLAAALSEQLGATLWPTSWPIALQVLLALAIGELGAYWVHRVCHMSPLGWRIHALHHSSEHLHFLSGGRNHPFNVAISLLFQFTPLILLGIPAEIVALMTVFTGVNGTIQHCNIDLRPGIFNWVFSTPDVHRWHHSKILDESNTNFGSNLVIWDILFGTHFNPNCRPATQLGIDGATIPRNFWKQLASPFVYSSFEHDTHAKQV